MEDVSIALSGSAPRLKVLAHKLRYEALTWFGITGAAITLFTNLNGIITFSDWAGSLVHQWSTATHALWHWVFAWPKLDLSREAAALLTFLTFALSTICGSTLSYMLAKTRSAGQALIEEPSLPLPAAYKGSFILLAVLLISSILVFIGRSFGGHQRDLPELLLLVVTLLENYAMILAMLPLIVVSCRDKLNTLLFLALYLPFPILIAIVPVNQGANDYDKLISTFFYAEAVISAWLFTIPLALILLPASRLNRRFVFILIGTALLAGLNELSKLAAVRGLAG